MVVFAPLFGFDYTLERRGVRYGHGFEKNFFRNPRSSVYRVVLLGQQ
jgi:hypothetical protein